MLYIVQGYIFISVYNFILFKDHKEEGKDYKVLKSIVTSYVLKVIYDFIINLFFKDGIQSELVYNVILIVISVLSAYLLASIAKSKILNRILLIFGIHRTMNDDLWLDIMPNGTFLRVYSRDGKESYLGLCTYWEQNAREPLVCLEKYQILDEDDEIILDYFDRDDRSIVLNLANFERIDIIKGEKKDKEKTK